MIKVVTSIIVAIAILGALAAFVIKSLEPVIQQFVAESQIEVAHRTAGKIVEVTPLKVGYFEQDKSLVKTTEGSYFVSGLVSYQKECQVWVSKRLNDQRALCICNGEKQQCYWIY